VNFNKLGYSEGVCMIAERYYTRLDIMAVPKANSHDVVGGLVDCE
jgi:hypothetical protein